MGVDRHRSHRLDRILPDRTRQTRGTRFFRHEGHAPNDDCDLRHDRKAVRDPDYRIPPDA